MKKLSALLCAICALLLSFGLAACGECGGTYYPPNEKMKTNLEKDGYAVTLYQDLSDSEGNHHGGTLLYASKSRENESEEYLYFYRFENSASCEYYYNSLEKTCKSYNALVTIENDEKHGNIVYCGTNNAIDAAGIKVVKVDVNVKV